MSTPHIPPVTIEDLQAFQAKHFPGSTRSLVSEYTYNENIEIFRHSEIHSLMRERLLKEEEEVYQKAAEINEIKDNQADDKDTSAKRSGVVGETDQSTGEDQQARTLQSDTRQSVARNRTVDNSSDPTLDYDEDASEDTCKPAPSGYNSHIAGRRIISYED
ncbi:hypothetical protein AFCA_001614 [Aspergillus flavus]|nr:hypothetical protein AFCA_001614 [Aspergillus flavus]